MKYFIILWSLDTDIMGYLPQVKEVIHNSHVSNDPRFIQHYNFKKVDIEPVISSPVLDPRSHLTDVIQSGGIGFSFNLVISKKLKLILEKYADVGFQFFPATVFSKGIEYQTYWLMHPYEFRLDYIDFSKSEVFLTEMSLTRLEQLPIKDFNDYVKAREEIIHRGFPYSIHIDKFAIKDDISDDFFALRNIEGGMKFLVSEKLKNEIEYAYCTGIEFQPHELSFDEWTKANGARESQYGKV